MVRPFSEVAGIRCRAYSLPLERAIADFGADVPFGQVAPKMKEHYGIDLAACAPRLLTERVARELTEADCLPAARPSHVANWLIVETDGGMVPIVETLAGAADARKGKTTRWREAKVCIAQRQGEVVPKGVGVVYWHASRGCVPYGYAPGFRQELPRSPSWLMQQAQFALPGQIPACPGR